MRVIVSEKKKRISVSKEELLKSPIELMKVSYGIAKIFFSYKSKVKKIKYLEVEGTLKEFDLLIKNILKGVE